MGKGRSLKNFSVSDFDEDDRRVPPLVAKRRGSHGRTAGGAPEDFLVRISALGSPGEKKIGAGAPTRKRKRGTPPLPRKRRRKRRRKRGRKRGRSRARGSQCGARSRERRRKMRRKRRRMRRRSRARIEVEA